MTHFCNVIISSEDNKMLEFNQYQKSDKAPSIIYADLEFIIEKTDGCKNNPENFSTTKVSEYIPSGFSMSIISSFRSIENIIEIIAIIQENIEVLCIAYVIKNIGCLRKFI